MKQGSIGNCYFIIAAVGLAEWPELIRKSFLIQNKNVPGIFAIRFFIRGKPYVITVDDNILFKNGTLEPLYSRPTD